MSVFDHSIPRILAHIASFGAQSMSTYLTHIVAADTLTNAKLNGAATAANNVGDKLHLIGLSLLEHCRLTGSTAQMKILVSKLSSKSCHRTPLIKWVQAHSPIRIIEVDGVVTKVKAAGWEKFNWDLDAADQAPHTSKAASTKKEFDLVALTKYLDSKGDAEKAAKQNVTLEAQLAAEMLASYIVSAEFASKLEAAVQAEAETEVGEEAVAPLAAVA
jgi:hypothetical protein